MNALESGKPDVIATANIGCQTHLAGTGRTPVRHWIELIEEALQPPFNNSPFDNDHLE
jgi:glycolate oxidase iron-sulfur subunit